MNDKVKIQIVSGMVAVVVAIVTALGTVLATLATNVEKIRETQSQIAQTKDQANALQTQVGQISAPTGTIVSYGGPIDADYLKKAGWLVCNGDTVSRDEYKDLFHVIGGSWGEGDRVNTFNLPDLRGVFLRGVNGARNDAFRDPEADIRTNGTDGGNAKNAVGSFEMDEFKKHNHDTTDVNQHPGDAPNREFAGMSGTANLGQGERVAMWGEGSRIGTFNIMRGGSETRPKNAYVYYLIKY